MQVVTHARLPSSALTPANPLRETPLIDISLRIRARWRQVGLKLESYNPGGSIKYRTACGLIHGLELRGLLRPGSRLVESTSGNLGVALALLSRARGYHFTAVTDPKTDPAVLQRMAAFGAHVVKVMEPDDSGGHLLSRLAMVRQILAQEPSAVWPNQYENLANPAIHYHGTGPEVLRQRPDMDAIFIAASTGGTLAGTGRYLRLCSASVRIIAVDILGSRVFGRPGGRRLLTGIGSSRPSSFLRSSDYHEVVVVRDEEAIATCHYLHDELGIGIGGSSGAVVAACARYLTSHDEIRRPVCICPDGRANYLNTIYDKSWLARHGLRTFDTGAVLFDDCRGRLP